MGRPSGQGRGDRAEPRASRLGTLVLVWAAMACGAEEAEPTTLACRPQPAGLAITEWLANPSGPDLHREWIEICNTGNDTICLDRATLRLGPPWALRAHALAGAGCLGPGDFRLLGDGGPAARARAGGVPVDLTWGTAELPNAAGRIEVVCGPQLLAEAHYGAGEAAPVPLAGHATARAAPADDWTEGTDGTWSEDRPFCHVYGSTYDGRDMGTPGLPNGACRQCEEGGAWRPQRRLQRGELALARVQADPKGKDRDREWIELINLSEAPIDLSFVGLEVAPAGRAPRRWSLLEPTCGALQPGELRSLPVLAAATAVAPAWVGPTLPNRAATYRLLQGTRVVDARDVRAASNHLPVALLPDSLAAAADAGPAMGGCLDLAADSAGDG